MMWLNNGSCSPNGEGEEEGFVQHPSPLPSLLPQYQALVEDMAAQLRASHLALNSAIGGQSSDDEMSAKNAIISALETQIHLVTKSKQVWQNMAALILERVEELEMERLNRKSKTAEEISPQILRKWEDLNSYRILLEAKIEGMDKELELYKRKVLELGEEGEGMRKSHQQEKLKIIQNSRIQYQQEIDKLESQIEKLKQDCEVVIKGRLEKERESWEFEEAAKLVLVRVQVEALLKENHFLVLREQELQRLAFAMEAEREELRQRLSHATSQLAQASQQLQQLAPLLESEKVSKQCQTGPMEEELLASQNKERHEEEKRVESIQKHFEAEREVLISQLKSVEIGALKNSDRLQGRITQLEVLNINLRSQLKDAEDKEEGRGKREEELKCRIKELEVDVGWQNKQMPSESLKKELKELKQRFISKLELGEGVMEGRRKDLLIARLRSEIQRLVHLVEKQSQISSCWKSEFKKLAQQSLRNHLID